ncbi:MAG: adenylate kinase [Oligoflexia bacterium]|nr:adenylate kinase [Oligoflexia bacterium]
MRIVLLGPPGAGKGTQAVLLAEKRGIPHISTGQMMRDAVSSGSDLGKKVKKFLDAGELVPDNLVIELIKERLSRADCRTGFLLDGFPRTLEQAKSLTVLLKSLNKELTHVIEITVPESVILERIKRRGETGSGRSDDNTEVASKRLQVYWAQTAPVSKYYQELGSLVEVNGLGTIEEVQSRIQGKI